MFEEVLFPEGKTTGVDGIGNDTLQPVDDCEVAPSFLRKD